MGTLRYRIYLIKRPGVYFISMSVKGAFKRDGRLFVISTSNSCTAAVIMLFLAAATALSLNHRSGGVSTSVLVSLSLCHHKKIYYSILPCLQLVPRAISAPPTVPRPYMGDYLRWAFIDKDRAFTMGV